MSDEEIASILRAIQATLRRIEATQLEIVARQEAIKPELETESEAQPELGGISEIIRERTGH